MLSNWDDEWFGFINRCLLRNKGIQTIISVAIEHMAEEAIFA